MPQPSASPIPPLSPSPKRALRVGFLALTDAAPFAVAEKLGLFTRRGLNVELRREIGWVTIREKIIYGELDAAQAPAPMLWSAQLGLGCPACEVLTALVLNLHGNALTLSTALWNAGVRDAASLRVHLRERRARHPLTFGVVFPFSSHHLLLLEWLRAAQLDPERDVRIVIVPPAQMFRNLAAGTIDGYCVGEPWNSYAVQAGAGWCPTWSAAQQPGHLEKVLMVTRRFAETRPAEHAALVAALTEAAAWCDEPQNRERIAEIMAEAHYLNLPTQVLTPALLGKFDRGHGQIENVPDFFVFHRAEASVPNAAKGAALQRDMIAAQLLPEGVPDSLPAQLFREDIFQHVVNSAPHANHA